MNTFSGILSKPELVNKKTVSIWIVVTIAFLYLLVIEPFDDNKLDLLLMRLSGVVTSILAGMIFAFIYQRKENEKLDAIRSVGQQDLIEEVLNEVAHYQGIYCENHSMDARLIPHPGNKDFYLCIITHDYKKSRLSKELNFVFYRMNANTRPNEIPDIADEALIREFVWYNDESDFALPPTEADYKIEGLYVDGKSYLLQKRMHGDHIFFHCELPHAYQKLTHIRFDVTVPIEKESILVLTSEFPSKRMKVVFRWNDVLRDAPNLTVFPTKKLGLKTSPTQLPNNHGSYEINHYSWALPKDSCIFTWWNPK
jgi:hypothetical protein